MDDLKLFLFDQEIIVKNGPNRENDIKQIVIDIIEKKKVNNIPNNILAWYCNNKTFDLDGIIPDIIREIIGHMYADQIHNLSKTSHYYNNYFKNFGLIYKIKCNFNYLANNYTVLNKIDKLLQLIEHEKKKNSSFTSYLIVSDTIPSYLEDKAHIPKNYDKFNLKIKVRSTILYIYKR